MNKNELGKTISRNSLFSGIYYVWYLGSRLALTPLVLVYITIEEYGLWSFCFVVLGYLALSAFGFNNTYIRYAAYYRSREENEKLNELLSTGLITMTFISIIMFAVFWSLIPWLLDLLGINPELHETAKGLLIGTAAIFVLNLGVSGYQYILEGEQQIVLVRKIQIATTVVEILLIIVFLKAGLGVISLLCAYVVRSSITILLSMFFAHRVFPFLHVGFAYYSREALEKFMGFGNQMNLLGILSFLTNSIDRIFITRMLHLEAMGIYEVGRKLPGMGMMFPASIAGALMPAASHLDGSLQQDRLNKIYLVSTRYIMVIAGIPFAFMIIFAPRIIDVWVGTGYAQSAMVMQILALGTFVNLFTVIGTSCMRGLGRPVYEIKYMIVSLVLIIALTPVMIYYHGLIGAAGAYSIAQTVGSIYFLIIVGRIFKTTYSSFSEQVVTPVVIIFLLGMVPFVLCNSLWQMEELSRWQNFGVLVFSFAIYIIVILGSVVLFHKQILSSKEIEKISSLPIVRRLKV